MKKEKNKYNIGLFIDSSPGGGAFQYCISMISAFMDLKKNNYSTRVVYVDPIWGEYLKDSGLKHAQIKPHQNLTRILRLSKFEKFPILIRRFILNIFHPIPKALKKQNCDLWIFPSRNEWSYLSGVNSLAIIHDLMHRYENFPEVKDNGEYERREKICHNICKYCYGVIVDSKIGRQQFLESYSINEKKVFILNFVPPTYIYNKTNNNFKNKFNVPDKYVFYPARFWPHKNHINLILAINNVKKNIPDIKLVLTGSTNEIGCRDIIKIIKDLELEDYIEIFDYVPDKYMIDFYKNATMMIMPTFFGPTNIPPLESFVSGCPVAVSNIYGMPEQIGNAGLFFDPKSPLEIANIINSLWNNKKLREELITKGYKKAEEYNQENFNKNFIKIINSIIKKPI